MCMRPSPRAAAPGLILALTLGAGAAHADPLTPAGLNAGYGRVMGQESRPVEPSTRDASNNRVIVNGLLADPSGLAGGLSPGLGDSSAQTGGIGVQAIANQINIVANGSWNTIVVEATQTNTGAVQASAAVGSTTVANVSR